MVVVVVVFLYTPFTRYNQLSNRVVKLVVQQVVKPVVQPAVSCKQTSNWLSAGYQTGLTTGWMFVYTIQPVVKPVVQPVSQPAVSCKQGIKKHNNNNNNHLWPFVRDYLGEPVPEETFTHSPSWSSSNVYQLLPPTMIHSILPVQITCLAQSFNRVEGTATVRLTGCQTV